MSLYKQFKTDASVEKQGVLLQYGTNSKGLPITIRVARAGGANDAYARLLESRLKPLRRQIANDTAQKSALLTIVREVFAETVVLGWEGVEDAAGNALAFSKSAAVQLFTDLPDLFDDVQEQAQRSALFRAELNEADSGN